jgi:hypothetical protein
MCCPDKEKVFGWMLKSVMAENKPPPKITHASMVQDMEMEISNAIGSGRRVVNTRNMDGTFDVVFIERFWRQTGVFLQTTTDPEVFRFHCIEHV